jgi:hypothetical protein
MLRRALAVVAGLIAWFAVATVANLIVRYTWPGYADVEVAMSFTLPMMVLRLLIGAVSSLCAGLVTALIARSGRYSVPILAGVLFVLFIPVHYSLWARFPVWYHLVFLSSLVLLPFLGAAGQSLFTRRAAEATAAN